MSQDLGLEPKQIRFWFQNKRTQAKAHNERADNSGLRTENEKIGCENEIMKEALKAFLCQACGGPPPFGEERLQELRVENAHLREERERVSSLLANYIGKPVSQIDFLAPLTAAPPSLFAAEGMGNRLSHLDLNLRISDTVLFPYQFNGVTEMEKTRMSETVASAMDELIKLLRANEPLWVKSPNDGRYVIHHDSYEELFHRAAQIKSSSAQIESSKDSTLVGMSAMQLVEMFLDSNRWADLFPRIVTKARTIQVLETGMVGTKHGALLLMYAEMHILSPLVAPRKFYFLRHCQKIEAGQWAVVDVSYDFLKQVSRTWKLPSGCMIQDMSNGCSKVTWVEHVEVDDKSQTHRLFRDLIYGSAAYGSDRWVTSLERMCERLLMEQNVPTHVGGVITMPQGRRSIMKLSERMVKSFCSNLSMTGKSDPSQFSEVNIRGVRISVRKSTEPGHPTGIVLGAACSLWLPLPCDTVFGYLRDDQKRPQWDVLCCKSLVAKVGHISTGNNPGNYISIIRPCIPTESMLILQEFCTDALGSSLIYAPLDFSAMHAATSGVYTSYIPILSSGFIVSGDGRPKTGGDGASSSSDDARSGGSILTVAFNILASTSTSMNKDANVEGMAKINTLITSTVKKIKAAFNCPDSD